MGNKDSAEKLSNSTKEGGHKTGEEPKQQADKHVGARDDALDCLSRAAAAVRVSTTKDADSVARNKRKMIEQNTGSSLVGTTNGSAGLQSKSGSAEVVSSRSDASTSIVPTEILRIDAPEKLANKDDAQDTTGDPPTAMIEETLGSDLDEVLLTCVPVTTKAEAAPQGGANSSDPSGSDTQPPSEEVIEEILNQAASVASGSSSVNDGTVKRDYDPHIGDRVYACYDENDDAGWYWGNTSAYEDGFYSIQFEDNDYAERVSRKNPNHILTVWEYMHIYETSPPPVKENDQIVATLSPRQMYASRCKWCELCKKPDCFKCASCRNNKGLSQNSILRQACLQKMCTKLSDSQKKQPAEGILPPGWTFMFTKDQSYASGIMICRPESGQTFRSIQGAVEYVPSLKQDNPSVVDDFNAHVGMAGAASRNTDGKKKSADDISRKTGLTYQDMYSLRCKKCEQCVKPNCGSCWSCRTNKKSPNRRQRACQEKICQKLPKSQTKHPANRISSVKKEASDSTSDRGPPIHNLMLVPASMNPREMYARRCKECALCKKSECGSCASCTNNKSLSTDDEREVCLQKMCLKIPELAKKQPAKGMPRDWTFIFTQNKRYHGRRSYVPGLLIFHPKYPTITFRSAEAAAQQVPELTRSNANVATDFYNHIGIKQTNLIAPPRSSPKETESICREGKRGPKPKRPYEDQNSLELDPCGKREPKPKLPFEEHNSLESAVSSKGPCGMCKNCTKDACGECSRCKNSPDGTHPQCFQKMCYQMPVEAKIQAAVGFPLGWKFYFAEDPEGSGNYSFDPVPGLFILSKGNKKFRSVEAAVDICVVGEEKEVARTFYTHVGLPHEIDCGREKRPPRKRQRTLAITDYSLPGRGVRFEWTDLSGQKKIVYGEVAPCDVDENGDVPVDRFKVMFSPASSLGVSAVTEMRVLPLPLILGGCISLEQQVGGTSGSTLMKQLRNEYEYLNWIVPETRYEESVGTSNGIRLPRLTLIVRGHRLEFRVKQSSIPNAGYGVYVRCTPLTKGPDGRPMGPFVLQAGNLIDLGIYGPFRLQDKKLQAVFFAKNFIFSHECEEWVHQAGDSGFQLDITDDGTGEIHDEAKRHILAYVNENSALDRVCIRAEHDAQDNVHYLLGHEHQSQGSFTVPSDGSEMEVFAHYLDGYEKVRIRKGYGFLPDGEKKDLLLEEIASEDVDDAVVMNGYDAADVQAVLSFLSEQFLSGAVECSSKVIGRLLVVATVLQRRAKRFRNKDESNLNLEAASRKLVSSLLTMAPDEYGQFMRLQNDGNVDKVLLCVLKMNFSPDEVLKLATKLGLEQDEAECKRTFSHDS